MEEFKINSTGCDPLPNVRRTAVFPDHFSKMNVNDAKALFTFDTLIYISNEIAKELGCIDLLKSKKFPYGFDAEQMDWTADQLDFVLKERIEKNKFQKRKLLP